MNKTINFYVFKNSHTLNEKTASFSFKHSIQTSGWGPGYDIHRLVAVFAGKEWDDAVPAAQTDAHNAPVTFTRLFAILKPKQS